MTTLDNDIVVNLTPYSGQTSPENYNYKIVIGGLIIYQGKTFVRSAQDTVKIYLNDILDNFKIDPSVFLQQTSGVSNYYRATVRVQLIREGLFIVDYKDVDVLFVYDYQNTAISHTFSTYNLNLIQQLVPHYPLMETNKLTYSFSCLPDHINTANIDIHGLNNVSVPSVNLQTDNYNYFSTQLYNLIHNTSEATSLYTFKVLPLTYQVLENVKLTVTNTDLGISGEYIQLYNLPVEIEDTSYDVYYCYESTEGLPRYLFMNAANDLFIGDIDEYETTSIQFAENMTVDDKEVVTGTYVYSAYYHFLTDIDYSFTMTDLIENMSMRTVTLMNKSSNEEQFNTLNDTAQNYIGPKPDGDYIEIFTDVEEADGQTYITINGDKAAELDTCPSRFYLKWLDSTYGVMCQPFKGKNIYTEQYDRQTVTNAIGHKKPSLMLSEHFWELNSGWIDEYTYIIYQSILTSPFIQLYDTKYDKLHNVIVTDNSYEEKTYKNIQKLVSMDIKLQLDKTTTINY